MITEKAKALELALGQIDRQFGRGTVMRLGDSGANGRTVVISTGTLAFHVMAEAQLTGGTAAYLDAEHALDPAYAARCGLNTEDLLVSQPDSAEQCLEITEYLVRSGALDIVVIDSVAALVPRAEIEGEMGDTHVGLQARLMSQALRKLTSAISRSKTAVVFINQIREKVGVIWGSPEVTPGGRALKFYSWVRIDLRRLESIKQGTDIVGSRIRARVVKNKVAPPFRVAEFDVMFDQGISKEGDLVELGAEAGFIKKSGSFYSFDDTRLGQGRENAKAFLREHPDVAAKVEGMIRAAAALDAPGGADAPAANDDGAKS